MFYRDRSNLPMAPFANVLSGGTHIAATHRILWPVTGPNLIVRADRGSECRGQASTEILVPRMVGQTSFLPNIPERVLQVRILIMSTRVSAGDQLLHHRRPPRIAIFDLAS